jgi:uncharacterized membrane protein YfcA
MLAITDIIILAICGCIGGFMSGYLGVGGGIVYIPVLDYFLYKLGLRDDDLVKSILANSLFTIIFSGSVASYKQYRTGNFYPREILLTAIPGMVSSLFLTWLIKSGDWYSKGIFNYVFASMMLLIIIRMFFFKPHANLESEVEGPSYKFNITGLFAGVITAFSGLGGGVVMTPVFTDWIKINIKKASSISNGVIPLFALGIGIYNLTSSPAFDIPMWHFGFIVFPVVIPLIAATFIFAPLGVKASHTSSQKTVRLVFASFVSLIFVKVLYEILTH